MVGKIIAHIQEVGIFLKNKIYCERVSLMQKKGKQKLKLTPLVS